MKLSCRIEEKTSFQNKTFCEHTLLILAAGMGSRYGGLKQLDTVGAHGETLLDYSVYDAVRAGFSEVVFVIRREIEEMFRAKIGNRYEKAFPQLVIKYAFQEMSDLTEKSSFFSERLKPWGTGHALLAARSLIKRPFALINADDYYGASGYQTLADFVNNMFPQSTEDCEELRLVGARSITDVSPLSSCAPSVSCSSSVSATLKTRSKKPASGSWAMIGYPLKNTLSEHGTVSRGICNANAAGFLTAITERTAISKHNEKIIAQEKDGSNISLTGEELVSLNFWALTPDVFSHLEEKFTEFLLALEKGDKKNQTSAEFYLPSAISECINESKASVRLLPSNDAWFGLTHPADLPEVKMALNKMSDGGKYPSPLF